MRLLLALFLVLWAAAPAGAAFQARAALLYNLSTGRILFERNADARIAPASLTKIMTMYVALDACRSRKQSLHDRIAIPAYAAKIGGSAMGLSAGEKVPLVRLLSGMAVSSGNDAATAVALHFGGTLAGFAKMMNARAASLGMKSTQFKNPTGLPQAGHVTTARDLMRLCRAYLQAWPKAARFHNMKFFMHKGRVSRNTNPLLGVVDGVDGLKTGWTIASGYNLIVTATRGKTRLLAIVLGCHSREARDCAAKALLEAGFRFPDSPQKATQMLITGPGR